MQRNVGGADRVVRIIASLAIIGIGVYYKSWWGAIGIVPLGTALLGWCPPYCLLGINTCKTKQPPARSAKPGADRDEEIGGDG